MTTSEIIAIVTVLVTGGFVVWGEIIKRRTPSIEKEQEQEDQWRKELWEINRTITADLQATEKNLKETRKLLEQSEAQTALLQQQVDVLSHEKAAWQIEKDDMKKKIGDLERDVFDLTRKVIAFERTQGGSAGA